MTSALEIRINLTRLPPFLRGASDSNALNIILVWPELHQYFNHSTYPSFALLSLHIFSRVLSPSCSWVPAGHMSYQSQALVQDLILAVSVPWRSGCGLSLTGWERWLGAGAWSRGVIFRKCWRHRNMRGRRRHAMPPLTQGETYRKQHVG